MLRLIIALLKSALSRIDGPLKKLKTVYQDNSLTTKLLLITIIFLISFGWLIYADSSPLIEKRERIVYSDFKAFLDQNQIESLTYFTTERKVWGTFSSNLKQKNAKFFTKVPTTNNLQSHLESLIEEKGEEGMKIDFNDRSPQMIIHLRSVFWTLLFVGPFLIFLSLIRGQANQSQSLKKFTRTKNAKLKLSGPRITFKDVGGIDEVKEELEDIIRFLKNPKEVSRLGGKIPKGALMIGLPGVGKTLLAKAVAGEADVPFFPIAGSEFVEIFVGVGPARVRNLFKKANLNKPCIIFIDDIDSVGRARGTHNRNTGNQEYENTLLQLLVEMDGIDSREGVVVLGATNAPERLDAALVRPGRFDKQLVINRPDIKGREEILKIHVRKIKMDPKVDLKKIAKIVPGFVGADLANLVNEATLLATREDKKLVTQKDFFKARDIVMLGAERRIIISDEEKQAIAFHEAGHALVSIFSSKADPVEKVTIIPRGKSLGSTLTIPEEDKYLINKKQILAQIRVLMAGRVAEELITHDLSTGAGNDLERASMLAQKMVCQWGMSKEIGPVVYAPSGNSFLDDQNVTSLAQSDEVRNQIENEVKSILTQAEKEAKKIILKRQAKLELLVQHLLEKETLDGNEVYKLLGVKRK